MNITCSCCSLHKSCTHQVHGDGPDRCDVLILGEAPGCVSGDTLIEVAYRDKEKFPQGIPIKELVGRANFKVYSFDTVNQCLVLGNVKRVWKTGRKRGYRIFYEWTYADGDTHKTLTDSVVVSANHPLLLKRKIRHDPFKSRKNHREDYLSIENGLSIGDSLQPFYHNKDHRGYGLVGTSHKNMRVEGRFLLSQKVGRDLTTGEDCHHKNRRKNDDTWFNLSLQTKSSHTRLHMKSEDNPMWKSLYRRRHRDVMTSPQYKEKMSSIMKEVLANPEVYKKRLMQIKESAPKISQTLKNKYNDPDFYYKYLVNHRNSKGESFSREQIREKMEKRFPKHPLFNDNHKITRIEPLGFIDVYDLEVENYHNFAAHGIFLHNSEEDEQGRPFVGKTGKFLRPLIDAANTFDLRVRYSNVVRCRPPNNRKPTKKEITACNFHLRTEILRTKPKVVFLLGGTATQAVLGETSIKRIRGRKIIRNGQIYFATYHPSFIQNYSRGIAEVESEFQEDILKVMSLDITKSSNVDVQIVSVEEATRILYTVHHSTPIAFDIEATTLDPHLLNAEILCVSFAFKNLNDEVETYCVNTQGTKQKSCSVEIRRFFQTLAGFRLTAHNGIYDCGYIEVITGVNMADSLRLDTMQMQYAIDERAPKGLKSLVSAYLPQYSGYESEVQAYSSNDEGFENVPIDILMYYCGVDSFCTLKLADILLPMITGTSVEDYYYDVLMAGSRMLCRMSQSGCAMDMDAIQRVETRLAVDIELKKAQILRAPSVKRFVKENGEIKTWKGYEFQVKTIFYNQGIKPQVFTPTGRVKLDIDLLESLHNPLADKFVQLSRLQKMATTYSGDAVKKDWIRPDGLVYSTFGFEAGTGRLSSRGPNIQNIPNPKKSELAKTYNIRSYFVSRFPKGKILSADYKAVELRVFALLSNCKFFKEIFARNGDPHREVAARINGCSLDRVTDIQREDAKTANFGALYDESAQGLAERHGHTQGYWEDFLKDYHKAIPELKQYRSVVIHGLKQNGYAESPFGARRHFDYRASDPAWVRGAMEREACNHPIQNAASNLTVISAIRLELLLRNYKSKLINLIHDCALIDWSPAMSDMLLPQIVKRIMENPNLDWLTIPTPVDITITPNWGGE